MISIILILINYIQEVVLCDYIFLLECYHMDIKYHILEDLLHLSVQCMLEQL
jgi:hypothetical protein